MKRPNVFLVGAPKCGTTSLTQYLAPHPDVFICTPRESYHFCTDLNINPVMRVADRQKYLDLFDKADEATAVMDNSVWHLYSKEAANNIHEFAPDAKILITLRQPIDMMWSLHGWFLYTAVEDILDFQHALDAQDDRRAGRRVPLDTVSAQLLLYTDVVTFSPQVKRYIDLFGRDRVKIILFDEFVADTPGVYRDVLEFMNVNPNFQANFKVHGAAQEIRNPGIKKFLRRHNKLRLSIGRAIPLSVRDRIGRTLAALGPTVAQREKTMPCDLRASLLEQFRPEILDLGELIEQDLRHWINPDAAS